jgi:hypothetical protein
MVDVMTLRLAQPLDLTDPLLLLDLTGIGTHYTQNEIVAARRIRCAVQLREPHLTAQLVQYNALVDDRFDWDAQVQEAA